MTATNQVTEVIPGDVQSDLIKVDQLLWQMIELVQMREQYKERGDHAAADRLVIESRSIVAAINQHYEEIHRKYSQNYNLNDGYNR